MKNIYPLSLRVNKNLFQIEEKNVQKFSPQFDYVETFFTQLIFLYILPRRRCKIHFVKTQTNDPVTQFPAASCRTGAQIHTPKPSSIFSASGDIILVPRVWDAARRPQEGGRSREPAGRGCEGLLLHHGPGVKGAPVCSAGIPLILTFHLLHVLYPGGGKACARIAFCLRTFLRQAVTYIPLTG